MKKNLYKIEYAIKDAIWDVAEYYIAADSLPQAAKIFESAFPRWQVCGITGLGEVLLVEEPNSDPMRDTSVMLSKQGLESLLELSIPGYAIFDGETVLATKQSIRNAMTDAIRTYISVQASLTPSAKIDPLRTDGSGV